YMNEKQVPQLFIASGASKWNDPKNYPWTMGWQPSYQDEARVYAKYILKHKPDAKVAVLYQNDDFGKDYLKGLKDAFGGKASMIVAEEASATSAPTIEHPIVTVKAAGADAFVSVTSPKFAGPAIKKAAEIAWTPVQIVANVSASVGGVMQPAGFENSQGILSSSYLKDGADPQWAKDPGMEKFLAFLKKDYPEANKLDGATSYGYAAAQTMVKVLEMCGDDLTRANVMKQAASMKDYVPDTVLPGISINTSATDFAPIKQLRLMRFKGEKWELFGDIISSNLSPS
ncbi:branched-chain amino acid ABC transporter substrate-binding protein, partial [Staphylococcus epidermidis]